jgi:hypothetical protein
VIIDLVRETCREEQVALLLVTHTPEVAEQFERVEHLDRFNQARPSHEPVENRLAQYSTALAGLGPDEPLDGAGRDAGRRRAGRARDDQQSFLGANGLGYNLIVGAKGSKVQLVLNTVYYLSSPVENIPYSFYKEFTEGKYKPYTENRGARLHGRRV